MEIVTVWFSHGTETVCKEFRLPVPVPDIELVLQRDPDVVVSVATTSVRMDDVGRMYVQLRKLAVNGRVITDFNSADVCGSLVQLGWSVAGQTDLKVIGC